MTTVRQRSSAIRNTLGSDVAEPNEYSSKLLFNKSFVRATSRDEPCCNAFLALKKKNSTIYGTYQSATFPQLPRVRRARIFLSVAFPYTKIVRSQLCGNATILSHRFWLGQLTDVSKSNLSKTLAMYVALPRSTRPASGQRLGAPISLNSQARQWLRPDHSQHAANRGRDASQRHSPRSPIGIPATRLLP